MENKIDDGGMAFPSKDIKIAYPKELNTPEFLIKLHEIKIEHTGMTLRDYFAGQALIGLISNYGDNGNPGEICYRLADQMIAEKRRSEQ